MLKKSLIATVCCVSLTSCETVQNNPNTAIGSVVGGAAGAGIGAAIGGGRGAAIGGAVGLLTGAAVGQYLDQQQRQLEQDLAGTGANVSRVGEQLVINMPGQLTFQTDSATIQPQFYPVINDVARTLNEYPQSYIDVVGHTDSTGAPQYNQQLSERRAASVSNALVGRGVNSVRIATYGQGETAPIATNDTPEGRRLNRRVEVRITPATES